MVVILFILLLHLGLLHLSLQRLSVISIELFQIFQLHYELCFDVDALELQQVLVLEKRIFIHNELLQARQPRELGKEISEFTFCLKFNHIATNIKGFDVFGLLIMGRLKFD